ncbi:MAG: HEPN domain-containing protein, partial [bacterium]|nr:HEPN domain-containing protein [bacterium]
MTITEKDRALLLKYRTNQAYEAIKGAEIAIDHNQFTMAVNRIYYGMFYILSALALKFGYKTSKHQGLISWFNKTFIKENKIELKYGKIIRDASDSRRDGDY